MMLEFTELGTRWQEPSLMNGRPSRHSRQRNMQVSKLSVVLMGAAVQQRIACVTALEVDRHQMEQQHFSSKNLDKHQREQQHERATTQKGGDFVYTYKGTAKKDSTKKSNAGLDETGEEEGRTTKNGGKGHVEKIAVAAERGRRSALNKAQSTTHAHGVARSKKRKSDPVEASTLTQDEQVTTDTDATPVLEYPHAEGFCGGLALGEHIYVRPSGDGSVGSITTAHGATLASYSSSHGGDEVYMTLGVRDQGGIINVDAALANNLPNLVTNLDAVPKFLHETEYPVGHRYVVVNCDFSRVLYNVLVSTDSPAAGTKASFVYDIWTPSFQTLVATSRESDSVKGQLVFRLPASAHAAAGSVLAGSVASRRLAESVHIFKAQSPMLREASDPEPPAANSELAFFEMRFDPTSTSELGITANRWVLALLVAHRAIFATPASAGSIRAGSLGSSGQHALEMAVAAGMALLGICCFCHLIVSIFHLVYPPSIEGEIWQHDPPKYKNKYNPNLSNQNSNNNNNNAVFYVPPPT
ncbi:unnamed protein product [Amoebophrya sp. A25]|nr:unnamed protein product [Amoebophrya sp. A25]|eukprot:GSA25T00004255001.1